MCFDQSSGNSPWQICLINIPSSACPAKILKDRVRGNLEIIEANGAESEIFVDDFQEFFAEAIMHLGTMII